MKETLTLIKKRYDIDKHTHKKRYWINNSYFIIATIVTLYFSISVTYYLFFVSIPILIFTIYIIDGFLNRLRTDQEDDLKKAAENDAWNKMSKEEQNRIAEIRIRESREYFQRKMAADSRMIDNEKEYNKKQQFKEFLNNENNNKDEYLSTLNEVQLADIEVIISRSKYDYECKIEKGWDVDSVATIHYKTYKEDEYRVPKEDRKIVAESRVDSFLNIREFIESFGTVEQKFSFNATVIASLMLSSNYINFDDSKEPLKFYLKYYSLIRGGIPYNYTIKSELLRKLFDGVKLKASDLQK